MFSRNTVYNFQYTPIVHDFVLNTVTCDVLSSTLPPSTLTLWDQRVREVELQVGGLGQSPDLPLCHYKI